METTIKANIRFYITFFVTTAIMAAITFFWASKTDVEKINDISNYIKNNKLNILTIGVMGFTICIMLVMTFLMNKREPVFIKKVFNYCSVFIAMAAVILMYLISSDILDKKYSPIVYFAIVLYAGYYYYLYITRKHLHNKEKNKLNN